MRLAAHLRARAPESRLWVSNGVEIRSGQLLNYVARVTSQLEQYRGRQVALACSDRRNLALALLALDGVAARVLILPGSIAESELRQLAEQAGCSESILSDAGAGLFPVNWSDLARGGSAESTVTEAAADTLWIIPTSGTTGVPKLVGYTIASLTRSLKTEKSSGLDLTWGLLYDLSRFAGLQVFLQALCGGSCLVIPAEAARLEVIVPELTASRCNALSATPSMWRKLLMTGKVGELSLRVVSLGGEIADQPVLSALAARFPSARITHIYASTEAGVGFSVKDGIAGFPASYLDTPPAGLELRIDADGFLHLRPQDCRQQYIGRVEAIADAAGWINTGDLVRQQGGRVLFLGRANGSINVGGRKVLPQEIEQVLHRVPGVALVRVSARKSSILGSLVEALVVPHAGVDRAVLQHEIRQACLAELEDFKRPAFVRLVDNIELTSAGKVARS